MTQHLPRIPVSFLAQVIWDPTQMYNHTTNDWDKEHDIPFDVRKPKAQKFMVERLEQWLQENPAVDVVRFTTFLYHFTLVFNDEGKEKFVDWFGYTASISVEALEAFEKEYGYRLRPEDIIDAGYHNTPFRPPSQKFWTSWISKCACSGKRQETGGSGPRCGQRSDDVLGGHLDRY